MKIAVNLTYLRDGKQPEGVGQFAINLFKGIQAIGRLDKSFHLFVSDTFYKQALILFPEAEIISIAPMFDFYNLRYHRFLKSLFMDRYLVQHFLKKDQYDILFHPYSDANVYISNKVPTLITLHDLLCKNYPEEFGNKYLRYINHRYEILLYQSARIVVPSQFVKEDVLKYYPDMQPNKITVINNPIWVDCAKTTECPTQKPYILSVNSIRNTKNLITLLKAFKLIEDKVDHHLILTGSKRNMGIDPGQYAAQNHLKKLIMTGYVSDEQRNYLYQNAALFVSPSLHEGFGMTPVEATLFEIPVLTTRETSIPEVTCNMVNYYEPALDHHVLAERILYLLENSPPKSELHRIKTTLAQKYDPKLIAALYCDVFETIRG